MSARSPDDHHRLKLSGRPEVGEGQTSLVATPSPEVPGAEGLQRALVGAPGVVIDPAFVGSLRAASSRRYGAVAGCVAVGHFVGGELLAPVALELSLRAAAPRRHARGPDRHPTGPMR